MNALSSLATLTDVSPETATVLGRDGDALTLRRGGATLAARRALSCLVEPEPGDLVLLGGAAGAPYVLAVLERPGGQPIRLALGGKVEIVADGGRLSIGAETLALTARQGRATFRDIDVAGEKANLRVSTISVFAEAIESIATRLLTRAKRSFRFIEETEQLRARDVDLRAANHLHLRGETTFMQGGALVKMDAKQIHMG